MIYIINGLPGTGKTTLSKQISKEFNIEYINDWEILKSHNIENKIGNQSVLFCKQYQNIILQYIKEHKNKDIVLDLEYSLHPSTFIDEKLDNFSKMICLGFASLNEETLLSLFSNSSANKNIKEKDLINKINLYKKESLEMQNACDGTNVHFVDICESRDKILSEILNLLKEEQNS